MMAGVGEAVSQGGICDGIAFFALCAKNHPQFIVWHHLSHEVIRHGHGFFNRQELPLERFSNDV